MAERAFTLMQRNEADSLYALFADNVKSLLKPNQLEGMLAQVEQMMGPYQERGPWEHSQKDGFEVVSSVVSFEHGQLVFVVSIDEQGLLNGMRLLPQAPSAKPEEAMPLPADAVELDDTVRTDKKVSLPCSVVVSGRSANPPMVVFVHGSGPVDRNETVMSNAPFLELSRQLAEHGISSLRYDKRTFVYHEPVSSMDEETIDDALAAVKLARSFSDRVFLIGHSLGAMLAPDIASRAQLDGIILMAGPARDLADVVREQLDYLLPGQENEEQRRAAMEKIGKDSPHYLQPQHQVEKAQQLSLPMLIMQGERDYQVSMQDFRLWKQALGDRKHVHFASYPALNHLFLPGEGKSVPQEYSKKGNIPAEVGDEIARFIEASSPKTPKVGKQ